MYREEFTPTPAFAPVVVQGGAGELVTDLAGSTRNTCSLTWQLMDGLTVRVGICVCNLV